MLLERLEVKWFMDNRQLLLNLIVKVQDEIYNNSEYVLCNQLIQKIGAVLLSNSDNNIDLDNICNLTDEEMSMFSSFECRRIINSIRAISNKNGWRVETVYKLIKVLHNDITENKMKDFKCNIDKYNELYKIFEQGLFGDNYTLVLDFIKMCLDKNIISYQDAFNLNFYILNESKIDKSKKTYTEETGVVELKVNYENHENIRDQIQEIFSKYDYSYDMTKMGDLDDMLVKYVDLTYLDYILSKFKDYGVNLNDLYLRKQAFYNIIIDNDKYTFDSIIKFIDSNECSLSCLLRIPSIFAKRKTSYVDRVRNDNGDVDNIIEISGSNIDFFNNIEIYKELTDVKVINDECLRRIGKFLCTPTSIVRKNLLLLERYKIIGENSIPNSIISLCGCNTEYIIDRIIEAGLYDTNLSYKIDKNGVVKQSKGIYLLDGDSSPLKFYKMKRAFDFGESIFSSNGVIKKVIIDDNESYFGVSLMDDNGSLVVVQDADILMSYREYILRKDLPDVLKQKLIDKKMFSDEVLAFYFDNLYNYRVYTPVDIFAASDKLPYTNLKGERIQSVFDSDFKDVISEEDIKLLSLDNTIKTLDNTIYCDVNGNSRNLKTSEFTYEFSHPKYPNVSVIVSRYKVLRLCKLLKEDGSWIYSESSNIDKVNTLLSVITKDMILSEVEIMMLKFVIKKVLSDGIIKVQDVKVKNRGGAR